MPRRAPPPLRSIERYYRFQQKYQSAELSCDTPITFPSLGGRLGTLAGGIAAVKISLLIFRRLILNGNVVAVSVSMGSGIVRTFRVSRWATADASI
jgi:hypothetical protein